MSEQSGLLREGFGRVWRYQRVLWWIFFINLVFALFGSMPALTKLESIGHSVRSQRLVNMFDYGAFSELTSNPEVDPFAAQGGSLHFAFVFFFFMLFLTGGILEAYRADRKLTTREFFEECGNYFWRWVRLLILMLIVLVPIAMLASGVKKLFSKLALESPDEKLAYWVLFGGMLLVGLLWMCVRLWFDMAQVRAVVEQEYGMWRNAGQAFRLTFSNFGSLFWLYFRISFVWWVIFALGFWIWTKMPPRRFEWTILVLEFVILTGFGTRLWQRASEMVWYQRRFLAARTPPVPVTPALDPLLSIAPEPIPPQS
jgi:hypothetical protein